MSSKHRIDQALSNWPDTPVEDTPVAPHRMKWDGSGDVEPKDDKYSSFVATSHYKPGEVVMVVYGDGFARARILNVFAQRKYSGDLGHQYRVQRETKKGRWSRNLYYTWPGYIQRGYLRAGLAPDLEGKISR